MSKVVLYAGPADEGGFEGSGEFGRIHTRNTPMPFVRLALTASSILIAPTEGEKEPLGCDFSDIETIGVTRAGRRESGVTITRRDGRVARFIFRPDRTLASELQRLGATVTQD